MSENKFYTLVAKKEQLLALLNTGFIDDGAWVKFVYEAENAGCEAMAENMFQRFMNYKQTKDEDWYEDKEEE